MKQYGIELVQFDDGKFGLREYVKNSRGQNTTSDVQTVDNVDALDTELKAKMNELYKKYEQETEQLIDKERLQ
ncbi:hypothetical protein ACRHK7_06660 [Weissella tructae]|uniref:hypothetical protein n=1 Tax=Weissella tructae TaxID=887702 RepID=UPI003D8E0EF1